jgi:Porin subfamily
MKPVKTILLGSAAGLFAVAGAQAADLAVKAAPVEYVKVCSLYGAGFWYIPGTDTCIKIGGFFRFEVGFNTDGGFNPLGSTGGGWAASGGFTRVNGQTGFRERSLMSFDARTQTEYGTLRSYMDIGQIAQTQATAGGNGSTGSSLASNSNAGGPNGGAATSVYSDRAFIQFAGMTAGRMRSFFDMVFLAAYSNIGQRFTGDSSGAGITGIAYTWQFGGGLSASLSLEDPGYLSGGHGRSTVNLAGGGIPINNGDTTTAFGIGQIQTNVKGMEFFDAVANIRLDQQWGFVGASFALHDASGGYYGQTNGNTVAAPFASTAPGVSTSLCFNNSSFANAGAVCGHPADKLGWAASLGGTWVNAFGLPGDILAIQGVYTEGAVGYATGAWGGSAIFGSGNKVGLGYIVDGVFDYGSSIKLTHMWSVNGAYEHNWNPQWKTSLYTGAMGIDFADGKSLICPAGNVASGTPVGFSGTSSGSAFTGGVSNCNPNSSWTQLGTRTMWTPHPDIDFSLDFNWTHLNTAFAGTANLNAAGGQFQPASIGRPAGTYTISNQDVLSVVFAVRRGFLF